MSLANFGDSLEGERVSFPRLAEYDAMDFCLRMKDLGVLAKPTHGDKIRLAPPLIITREQVKHSIVILIIYIISFNRKYTC